ncbi:hypothetical protein [Acidaminobacterium chupaoyuni]
MKIVRKIDGVFRDENEYQNFRLTNPNAMQKIRQAMERVNRGQ